MKTLTWFFLTKEQKEKLQPLHKEVREAHWEAKPGMIIFQIGDRTAEGCFLPEPYSKRMRAIMKEYQEETD